MRVTMRVVGLLASARTSSGTARRRVLFLTTTVTYFGCTSHSIKDVSTNLGTPTVRYTCLCDGRQCCEGDCQLHMSPYNLSLSLSLSLTLFTTAHTRMRWVPRLSRPVHAGLQDGRSATCISRIRVQLTLKIDRCARRSL